jgi:hypothetical protein
LIDSALWKRIMQRNRAALSPRVVVLHLRVRYVSKAAIFRGRALSCRPKIEVSLEFQGLGSLGAATCGDGFSLASLTAEKS